MGKELQCVVLRKTQQILETVDLDSPESVIMNNEPFRRLSANTDLYFLLLIAATGDLNCHSVCAGQYVEKFGSIIPYFLYRCTLLLLLYGYAF